VSPLDERRSTSASGRATPARPLLRDRHQRLRNRKVLLLRDLIAAGCRYADIVKVIATEFIKVEAAITEEWLVRSLGRRLYHAQPRRSSRNSAPRPAPG